MTGGRDQVLCRFQVSNFARHGLSPFYEWIVHVARREGVQGATVLKGVYGLRPDGTVLDERGWAVAHEVPVIVEVVDDVACIERLLAHVEPVFREGTITLEQVRVLRASGTSLPDRVAGAADVKAAVTAASLVREVKTMKLPERGVLLRIFIGESDRDRERDLPLFESIVGRARDAHLAGATVLKGPLGFGRHSRVHAAKLLELSTDLPLVVEIVDTEEKIAAFLPVVDELVREGLVTTEAVRVIRYVSPEKP